MTFQLLGLDYIGLSFVSNSEQLKFAKLKPETYRNLKPCGLVFKDVTIFYI